MFSVDSSSYSNGTELSLIFAQTSLVKWTLIILTAAITLLGVIGNTTVLVGSMKYRMITMDESSTLLLESIALADLLGTLLHYVPMLVSLVFERWVLGDVFCVVSGYRYGVMMTETMLITIMSCHRLRTLACPMSSDIKPIIAKAVISGVWVCWGLYVLIGLGVDHQTTSGYDPHTLLCGFKGKDGGLSPFVRISFFLGFSTIISGIFLISVTNIIMVCLVITSYTGEVGKKTTPGLKAARVVSLICLIFIISYIPWVVVLILSFSKHYVPAWMPLLCNYALSLNMVANPMVYCMINKRFSRFMKRMVTGYRCGLKVTRSSGKSSGKSRSGVMSASGGPASGIESVGSTLYNLTNV